MLTEIISTEFDKCRTLKTWTRKGLLITILRSRIMWKVSRKQEHERKSETRCEIVGNVLRNEKNDEWEVQNIESAELNKHLAAFIRSVRRKDGEDYEPSRLRCFVSSIERHLKKNNYTKFINDKEFELFRKYLQAKQWELKKSSRGDKDKAAVAITDEQVDILCENNMLGVSSAESLLNTVWLNNIFWNACLSRTWRFVLVGCEAT